jgi:predicted glycosyltransferase
VGNELSQALQLLNTRGARTKLVLLLKDILDRPETTAAIWQRNRYHEAIRCFYDRILVLGARDIFDLVSEYRFPPSSASKVHFCGYLRGDRGSQTREEMRGLLGVHDERLVLVTGGGGETGYRLMANYVEGFNRLPHDTRIKSLLVCGPEMSEQDRRHIRDAAVHPQLLAREFDGDLMSCIDAADVVVSLAGYNTVCDVLSLRKRAIVVPRVGPVQEQLIRAERMAQLGLLRALHPDRLTPARLMRAVMEELEAHDGDRRDAYRVDLEGMSRVASSLKALVHNGARLTPAFMT